MAATDVFMDSAGFLALWDARALFRKHSDKEWSFTDCFSCFAAMREFHVREAFTSDRPFKQAAFVPLLKA